MVARFRSRTFDDVANCCIRPTTATVVVTSGQERKRNGKDTQGNTKVVCVPTKHDKLGHKVPTLWCG